MLGVGGHGKPSDKGTDPFFKISIKEFMRIESAWFRPNGHEYLAGRVGTIVEPGIGLGAFIDDSYPAGHRFAATHDNIVGELRDVGVPDWLANIPTMGIAYQIAFWSEALNSALSPFGIDYFEHELSDDH